MSDIKDLTHQNIATISNLSSSQRLNTSHNQNQTIQENNTQSQNTVPMLMDMVSGNLQTGTNSGHPNLGNNNYQPMNILNKWKQSNKLSYSQAVAQKTIRPDNNPNNYWTKEITNELEKRKKETFDYNI
ncbi:13254_t:CDS:2 [Dentiscutata erythropus]|uniref:13254_t:CDS:1 n=1 Tax=Dentiscutata erythropus TaxID=1348616 RepID=A0A9N9NL58_9GLOM|nr:13254_t:CDS:2 [Dentiscutata erythropus]